MSKELDELPIGKFNEKGLPLDYFISNFGWAGGTHFERQNKIKPINHRVVLRTPDLLFAIIQKDDGSETLQIYFRVGKNQDGWLRWCILDSQAKLMIDEFPLIFQRLNKTLR